MKKVEQMLKLVLIQGAREQSLQFNRRMRAKQKEGWKVSLQVWVDDADDARSKRRGIVLLWRRLNS